MKFLTKRTLAWLTSLLMLISVFTSVVVLPVDAATVNYVYSGKYVYNWGSRGTVATFMSPMAEQWYKDSNTSYEKLSALSGNASASSVPSSSLYQTLKTLMSGRHTHTTGYTETKDLFKYTDCQNSGGKISSFYSGVAIGPSWDGSWNREHTWPNSKGDASGQGENDIIMLRPTSTSENSSRGNKAYGKSGGYYNPNSESGGKYDLRGDVARIMLFVYCRWGNTGKMWGSEGVMESRAVLLEWVEADPVDTWELGRNDAAQAITGTRNVFVDYPELIFTMFGEEVPTDYQTPSGEGATSAYAITATSNNTSYGTVAVNGKTITATPKTGYAVSDYTILSGNATVVRNGNVFTVNTTSDVSIRINFAARQQVKLDLVDGATKLNTLNAYSGDEITLPAYSGTVPADCTFVGWAESVVEETSSVPTYYPANSKYTIGADVVLYALFSRLDANGTELSNVFEPYTGAITEGDYLVMGKEGQVMIAAVTDKNRLQYATVTTADGQIIAPESKAVWHIAPNGGNWTIYNQQTGSYAAGKKVNNQAVLITTLTEFGQWTIAENAKGGYDVVNVGNSANGINPLLRQNNDVGYACYATNTPVGAPLQLYKRVGGTTYYFTNALCQHQYEEAAGQDASCGEDGSVTYLCSLCGDSYTEVIPATGKHIFDNDEDMICDECGYVRGSKVPGDINGDGNVNNHDLVAMQRYLNKWNVSVAEDALDVNGDGKVNNRDLATLQRYLANWDVTLH